MPTVTLKNAQRDMRMAYYGGAPGMLTSGAVWLAAALVAQSVSAERAIWVLFIGAVFIYPVSVLFCRVVGRSGKHTAGNLVAGLAMASTFWLIFCLPLAYAVSLLHIEWFFPAMLLVIGGRYLTFATIYGTRIYWICGLALAAAGYALGSGHASPALGAFAGAAIEALFAAYIFASSPQEFGE